MTARDYSTICSKFEEFLLMFVAGGDDPCDGDGAEYIIYNIYDIQ